MRKVAGLDISLQKTVVCVPLQLWRDQIDAVRLEAWPLFGMAAPIGGR